MTSGWSGTRPASSDRSMRVVPGGPTRICLLARCQARLAKPGRLRGAGAARLRTSLCSPETAARACFRTRLPRPLPDRSSAFARDPPLHRGQPAPGLARSRATSSSSPRPRDRPRRPSINRSSTPALAARDGRAMSADRPGVAVLFNPRPAAGHPRICVRGDVVEVARRSSPSSTLRFEAWGAARRPRSPTRRRAGGDGPRRRLQPHRGFAGSQRRRPHVTGLSNSSSSLYGMPPAAQSLCH
jgi:hypothetical protein